jgi:hypothetical protein
VSSSRDAAIGLAEEILSNIELSDISLSAVMLKCARLARILGDAEHRQIFNFEAGGYPSTPSGIQPDIFELGRKSGRVYKDKNSDGQETERMNVDSVEALEKKVENKKIALIASVDPNISISSANPNQVVYAPVGNAFERRQISDTIEKSLKLIAKSRSYAYDYVSNVLYELMFSGVASTIFDSIAERVDLHVIEVAPKSAQKMASIRANLQSENPEDWANAVHSCRRLLQDIADALYPSGEAEIRVQTQSAS